jgi:hypothetical protein
MRGVYFAEKLTVCCWGRGREGVHREKPTSVLDGICDISPKILVRWRLRRAMVVGLVRTPVPAVVHH